ncbi:pilus assembly protein, partial [Pseudomonas syringae pv. actinidiae]|nr:pilus assembly protein [Pseudomonas syringae pv. actinidiae]
STEKIKQAAMLGPLPLRLRAWRTKAGPGLQVVFSAINDYGGQSIPLTVPVTLTH